MKEENWRASVGRLARQWSEVTLQNYRIGVKIGMESAPLVESQKEIQEICLNEAVGTLAGIVMSATGTSLEAEEALIKDLRDRYKRARMASVIQIARKVPG